MSRYLESAAPRNFEDGVARNLESGVAGPPTLAIRREPWSTDFYYYIDWNPADYESKGDHTFQCYLTVEPGVVAEDRVYQDVVNWPYLYSPGAASVLDGVMIKRSGNTYVLGSLIAAQPPTTLYDFQFTGTGATAKLALLGPSVVTDPSGGLFCDFSLSNGVANWQDGVIHSVGTLTYASNTDPRSWANYYTMVYAQQYPSGVRALVRGPAPQFFWPMPTSMAALQSNGISPNLQYVDGRYQLQPIDKFSIGVNPSMNVIDPAMIAGWFPDDGTPHTAQLLLADYLTLADFTGRTGGFLHVVTPGSAYNVWPLVKSDDATVWTGPELFALKNQSLTIQKGVNGFIMGVAVLPAALDGSSSGSSTASGSLSVAVALSGQSGAGTGLSTTMVNEDFVGTAGTLLSATGRYSDWYWNPGQPYPELHLDGNGAAIPTDGVAYFGNDYGANINRTVLPDDCWAEIDFQYVQYVNRKMYMRQIDVGGSPAYTTHERWGYNLSLVGSNVAPRITLYRGFNVTVADINPAPALTPNVLHTARMECLGNNVKVFLDTVQVINYTDPSPLHGAYTGISSSSSTTGINADFQFFAHRAGGLGAPLGGGATGTLGVARPMSASASGTSTAAATLTLGAAGGGTSGGSSTTTGTLVVAKALVGSAVATSTATGALVAVLGLTAPAVTGTSSATGALAVARPLVATATGASTTTAAMVTADALVSSTGGTSTATGSLVVARALVATSDGVSTTTANMFASAAGGLSAFVQGTSTVTGSLRVARTLAGSANGLSTASATSVAKTVQLAGTAGGLSTTTGATAIARRLAGTSTGGSTTTGSFVGSVSLVGSASGISTANGALSRAVPMVASASGVSTAPAALVRIARALTGVSTGQTTVTGAARLVLALRATSDGLATADALNLVLTLGLVGSSDGTSTADGDLVAVVVILIHGLWNGQPIDGMQYGDKQVIDWLMIPS